MQKILVIDDEPQIVEVLEDFLTSKGYGVKTARSGQEALCILMGVGPVDLMILDEKMPGMDGSAVKKEMKRLGINIPVIVLSGSLGLSHTSKFKEMECDRLLIKPIRLTELLDVVREVLPPEKGGKSAKKKGAKP